MNYPTDRKNSGYFARFTKALFASNAVSETGKDAFLLVLYVASIEDRTHYNKPAKLWRSQLMEATAISSPKAILAARSKAIELGLLHYCEGSRTSQPIYWTLVPSWLELHMRRVPNRNVKTSTRSKSEHETEHETERLQEPSTQYPNKGASLSVSPSKAKTTKPQWKMPEGVNADHWQDWLTHRKAKRASNTPSAWSRIEREAAKARMTIPSVVQTCAERSWVGFESSWVASSVPLSSSDYKPFVPSASEDPIKPKRRSV